jgi:hypothetical protein
MTQPISALKDKHVGETVWIVGSGPSIRQLSSAHIGQGPVITLGAAVGMVEALQLNNPLYSMQKDRYDTTPLFASLLVHVRESIACLADYRPRYIFDNPQDFGIPWDTFSSLTAVHVALLMGCRQFMFVCHDACVTGDSSDFMGNYRPAYSGQAIVQHLTLARLGLLYSWITPGYNEPQIGGQYHVQESS